MGILVHIDDKQALRKAAEVVLRGGIIAYPTDTLYGLGADIFNQDAINRVYDIKVRDRGKPLLIVVNGEETLEPLVAGISDTARLLMNRFWPGPLTMVFEASHAMPRYCLAGGTTIAVRVPDSEVTLSLLHETGVPLTSSSANLSGGPQPTSADLVMNSLGDRVDLILDGGPCSDQQPSTILDVSQDRPRLLREGKIPGEMLEPFLR